MKKWCLVAIVTLMIGVMLLTGCSGGIFGVSQEEFSQLEARVARLSAISAYGIWYDQYYAVGNYIFASVDSFNENLGGLVVATSDTATTTAWDGYLATDAALSGVITTLPEDISTWTEEQYNQWLEASTARYSVLGKVGAALFTVIVQ